MLHGTRGVRDAVVGKERIYGSHKAPKEARRRD